MAEISETLVLETPEQLEINYSIARLGSRFIAALWDSLFIAILEILLFLGVGAVLNALGGLDSVATENWVIAIAVLLIFVILWGYYVIFELIWNGQSPGKRLVGIRTVRYNGQPIGIVESAIRNIVRIIDFLPTGYGFGVVSMFADRQSRRLGDFAAGTIVVHDKPAVALRDLGEQLMENEKYLEPAIPNLNSLSDIEIEAVRRFLSRRDELANEIQMASYLATRVRDRLEIEMPSDAPITALDNLEFLRRVAAQYRQR